MSERYPGGVITKNPATPTGPFDTGAAPGIWTLDQQLQYQQQGIWPTAGLSPNYIEDVFSTYLYTGNGSTQTITTGIDTSTYGGLVWLKDRSSGQSHALSDTARGVGTSKQLQSNTTGAATTDTFTGFTTSGFTLDASFGVGAQNLSAVTYASWTFREQPKFFDVVTYTGTGSNTTIAHNLGAVPGSIIVKRTDTTAAWAVYHRSLANTQYLVLNTTAAAATGATWWNSTTPTSSVFSVGTNASVNASGGTYVAYLFAHDAGGFGLTGTDNVISCGSFTADGSGNATVTLGYEPQWLLVKRTSSPENWWLVDNMRGLTVGSVGDALLFLNTSGAETNLGDIFSPTATGFTSTISGAPSQSYIYIAIRRGPMKVPTLGTSVFGLSARAGTGANAIVTGGQTDDAVLIKNRGSAVASLFSSRLTGTGYLVTSSTAAEVAAGVTILQANPWDVMDGVKVGTTSTITNASANTYINYLFRRAPGFFDVVCYTGDGNNNRDINHNLTVIPELFIVKRRSGTAGSYGSIYDEWNVGLSSEPTWDLNLLDSQAKQTGNNMWGDVAPTSTTFRTGDSAFNNASGNTYVAYLFATCAGVSKVGSYTGNAALRTINCGFTGGARFVLIKRTDSAGNWFVWDTARGMVAGYSNDPSLALNTTAAERYSESVLTIATGFQLLASPEEAVNTNGASYIFLAIA